MIDFDKLEADVCKANKTAQVVTNKEDGGTCNFDTPVINLGKLRKADRDRLAMLDWSIEPVESKAWDGWYYVYVTLDGQANLRTRMAKAAVKSLTESGWEATVYYQAD